MSARLSRRNNDESRPDRATFAPGDYGRVTRPDGTAQWYVRSRKGAWIAPRYQRIIENQDGTITLLSLA